jgi:tetratricopeptide repeat protein
MFHTRASNFKTALHYARLGLTVADTAADATANALSHSILGRALHFMGDHGAARAAFEASLRYWSGLPETTDIHLGVDHHVWVGVGLARTLWLQGYPTQATDRMYETIRQAERRDQPASLGFALFWAPELFVWVGNLRTAEEHADHLISHGESHFQRPYLAAGRGYKGALAIARGDVKAGVEHLQDCLEQFDGMHYRMMNTGFKLSLVQGLMAIGLFDKARMVVDETVRLVERNGDLVHMPEALRVRGRLSMAKCLPGEAEMCFVQSLDWSRRQGARSWELRTATDLATLWAGQGQRERAHALLEPILEGFAEGLDTADLQTARQTLLILR